MCQQRKVCWTVTPTQILLPLFHCSLPLALLGWGGNQTVRQQAPHFRSQQQLSVFCFFSCVNRAMQASHSKPQRSWNHQMDWSSTSHTALFYRLHQLLPSSQHPSSLPSQDVSFITGTKMWWLFQAFWPCSPGSFLAHCTFSVEI